MFTEDTLEKSLIEVAQEGGGANHHHAVRLIQSENNRVFESKHTSADKDIAHLNLLSILVLLQKFVGETGFGCFPAVAA